MVRIAKKTIELTIQVAPKSKAMCTTPLVSSSMKPAPRKNIRPLGPGAAHRGKREQDHQREHRHDRHAAQVEGGDRRLAEVEKRPVIGGYRVDARQLDLGRADLHERRCPGAGGTIGGTGPKPFDARIDPRLRVEPEEPLGRELRPDRLDDRRRRRRRPEGT